MKKIMLILILMLFVIPCQAETIKLTSLTDKLPPLKQGIGYSIIDNRVNYLSTLEIAKWKKLNFEAGVAGDADRTDWKAVGVVSYNLGNLQQFGIDVPILNYLNCNIGLYTGYGSINMQELDRSEFDWGLALTLIDIKF